MTPKQSGPDPVTFLPITELWFNTLLALSDSPRHGYGIIQDIERNTGGSVSPATGTMYLALQRLEEDGLIKETRAPDAASSGKRKRRFYELTRLGRQVMTLEAERLAQQLTVALAKKVIDRSHLRS